MSQTSRGRVLEGEGCGWSMVAVWKLAVLPAMERWNCAKQKLFVSLLLVGVCLDTVDFIYLFIYLFHFALCLRTVDDLSI